MNQWSSKGVPTDIAFALGVCLVALLSIVVYLNIRHRATCQQKELQLLRQPVHGRNVKRKGKKKRKGKNKSKGGGGKRRNRIKPKMLLPLER